MKEIEIKQKILEYLEPLAPEFIYIIDIKKDIGFTFDTQILRAYLTKMNGDGYIEQPSNVQDYTHFRITGDGKLFLQDEGGYLIANQVKEENTKKAIEQAIKDNEESEQDKSDERTLRRLNIRQSKISYPAAIIGLILAIYGLISVFCDIIGLFSD